MVIITLKKKVIDEVIMLYGKAIDGFIFLGDYVGDYPWGNKVVELMMELKKQYSFVAISGNRETGIVHKFYDKVHNYFDNNGHISLPLAEKLTGWSLETSMGACLYDCCQMTKEQIEFLDSLPSEAILESINEFVLLKHKTPISKEEIEKFNKSSKSKYLIVGHTHEPHDKDYEGIRMVNPGAIGLSDTGLKGAYYGIIERRKIILCKINYDYNLAINELRNNPLLYDKCEHWGQLLEQSIMTGINVTSLYGSEKKRLIEMYKRLSDDEKHKIINLDTNQALELSRLLFPALSIEEKPFSQNRYGNTDPYGNYIKVDFYNVTGDNRVTIDSKETISDDVNKSNKGISIDNEVPLQLINVIAYEHVLEYLKYANYYNISTGRVY